MNEWLECARFTLFKTVRLQNRELFLSPSLSLALSNTHTHRLTQVYLRASCRLPTFSAVQRNSCHGNQLLNWLPWMCLQNIWWSLVGYKRKSNHRLALQSNIRKSHMAQRHLQSTARWSESWGVKERVSVVQHPTSRGRKSSLDWSLFLTCGEDPEQTGMFLSTVPPRMRELVMEIPMKQLWQNIGQSLIQVIMSEYWCWRINMYILQSKNTQPTLRADNKGYGVLHVTQCISWSTQKT